MCKYHSRYPDDWRSDKSEPAVYVHSTCAVTYLTIVSVLYYLIHLCLLLPATSPSPPLPQLSPLPFSTQLEQIVLLIVEKAEGRACVVGSVWTSGVVVMCIAYLPMFPMYLFRNLTPFKYISFAR